MDVVYSQRESLAYNHDYINSDDENLVWNNSCEPDVKSEKTNPVSPISKEEIKKSIIQKCHKLAKLTGCSLFIKITDHEDDESQYYGTYDYVRDYQDNELRPDERDVAVSGESGVAITFADICTQQPWNMFMWTLNDSNKLSMISHQNDTDVPDNNDPEECNEKLSETDSQKTESANEEEMNVDNFQDDIVNDIDLDFDHQSKPEDLSQKKDDNESEEYKPAKLSTLPVNCVSPTTTASTLIMSTPTPAVLSRREHDNLLSCLPKLDSVGGLVGESR
uniref:Uncharacterized protein LOC100375524 n=1 Tax=Saccoglossus kowalevskii TaxID=10224 RepID=A0ABM0GQJ0_SACKO|nr:PREDICTED: uncharacterized protein LOC100375524 [Saccoglossus kowalevskii]